MIMIGDKISSAMPNSLISCISENWAVTLSLLNTRVIAVWLGRGVTRPLELNSPKSNTNLTRVVDLHNWDLDYNSESLSEFLRILFEYKGDARNWLPNNVIIIKMNMLATIISSAYTWFSLNCRTSQYVLLHEQLGGLHPLFSLYKLTDESISVSVNQTIARMSEFPMVRKVVVMAMTKALFSVMFYSHCDKDYGWVKQLILMNNSE